MTIITIDDVRNLAKKKGLKIVVKKHPKFNEFTIFIYDKRIQSRYLVGYDGSHSGNWVSWDDCCKMSYDYIIKNYGND